MAKENGLGWATASVDDSAGSPQAIKNDITNLQFATPRAVQDVTGVDKSAMERLLMLADFSITLNGVFNDASNMSHDVFKTIPTTSVSRTITLAVSGQTMTAECMLTDYPLTRGQDGALTWAVPGVLANGTAPTWS
jgi:hypothetical protein